MLNLDESNIKKILRKMTRANLLSSPRCHHYELSTSLQPLLKALLALGRPTGPFELPAIPPATDTELGVIKTPSSRRETEQPGESVSTLPARTTMPHSSNVTATSLPQKTEASEEKASIIVASSGYAGAGHYTGATASSVYLPNRAARRLARRMERQ